MQGLTTTFETLAVTRNEAAIDVLIAALDEADGKIRLAALDALTRRQEPRGPKMLLARWAAIDPAGVKFLRPRKAWMLETLRQSLRGPIDAIETVIVAAQQLNATEVVADLIAIAETAPDLTVRVRAGQAVLALVDPIGRSAREDRSLSTVRNPIVARLVESVRRFAVHRNPVLIEAFLSVSSWSDGELRAIFEAAAEPMNLICDQLAISELPGPIELLAGYIRRKTIPPRILAIMQTRTDEAFRDALLRFVGNEPSGNVIRNLRDMGMPKSCHGGESLVEGTSPENRAALISVYAMANQDNLETMHLITTVLRHGGPGCIAAASLALGKCEVPTSEFWMRAAVPIADDDQEAIALDENAQLLSKLIELLEHDEPALRRSVRRVLEPLHADAMLEKFHSLRPRSRRRLGRVVMMIDDAAVDRVRDALRHPVLSHRLEAIAMADALAIVDLLSDSFTRISRDDHQEARIRAAEVMSDATSTQTLELLEEMLRLPESPVRDAAAVAVEKRLAAKSKRTSRA